MVLKFILLCLDSSDIGITRDCFLKSTFSILQVQTLKMPSMMHLKILELLNFT